MICRPKYSVREERTGYTVLMWLLIKKFTDRDVGSYKCVSTNSLGKADGTLRLYGKLYTSDRKSIRFRFFTCFEIFKHGCPFSEIKIGFDRVGPRKDHVSIIGGKYI